MNTPSSDFTRLNSPHEVCLLHCLLGAVQHKTDPQTRELFAQQSLMEVTRAAMGERWREATDPGTLAQWTAAAVEELVRLLGHAPEGQESKPIHVETVSHQPQTPEV